MEEIVINIYLIDSIEYPRIMKEYSISAFKATGSDEEKLELLQFRTKENISTATKFSVPPRYQMVIQESNKNKTTNLCGYVRMAGIQNSMNQSDYSFFHEGFEFVKAPDNPLCAGSVLVKNTLMHQMTREQLIEYDVAQQMGYFKNDIF